MTPQQRLLVLSALSVAVAAPLMGAKPKPAPAAEGPKVFKTTCIGCHSQTKDGHIPRLEGLRATPEEWDNILKRMGRRGLTLTEAERHAMVKEIARYQSLTPEENAAVGYLAMSPAAAVQERVPSQDNFQRACASCHSFGKIASYRRTPQNWAELKNFHMGMFPATLTQSYRDMVWWDSADSAIKYLSKRFPYGHPQQKPVAVAGSWVLTGHQPGKGDYEATMALAPRGDDEYALTRTLRWASGRKQVIKGQATLYGGGALRCSWLEGGQKVTAAYTVAPAGLTIGHDGYQVEGAWYVPRAVHVYGSERGLRLRSAAGETHVLKLTPAWVRPDQGQVTVVATTDGPVPAGWSVAAPGIKQVGRTRLDANHVAFQLQVGNAPRGRVSLGLVPVARGKGPHLASDDRLIVARGVDYIKITPQKGGARVGGLAVPPDGVPFEAIGMSNGPDGKRHTGDDLALGTVPARWELQEYFFDFSDEDVSHIGKIDANGLFMPANEEPTRESANGGNSGNAWVRATVDRPGQEPLTARAYLDVGFPDMVKNIR